jgi:hypothetical protein
MKQNLTIKSMMRIAMNRVMPTCADVTHLVSVGMDERLPLSDRMKVRVHLLVCEWCSMFQGQIRFIRRVTRDGASLSELTTTGTAGRLNPDAKAKLQDAISREIT